MKILAIDPGPTESAYVSFVCGGQHPVESFAHLLNSTILTMIRQDQCPHDLLAIETIQCMGMPAGEEMFMTMFWAGRFCEASETQICGPRHELVKRSAVKMHLCGSMRAKDGNIRQALLDRFGGKAKAIGNKAARGPLYGISNHLWSALAIAVTVSDKMNQTKL